MVREIVKEAINAVNSITGLVAMLVLMGMWLGILTQRVLTIEMHPDKAAHEKQGRKQARTEERLDRLERDSVSVRSDIMTEIITKYGDDRWRRQNMYVFCQRAEKLNKGWVCPELGNY